MQSSTSSSQRSVCFTPNSHQYVCVTVTPHSIADVNGDGTITEEEALVTQFNYGNFARGFAAGFVNPAGIIAGIVTGNEQLRQTAASSLDASLRGQFTVLGYRI